MSKKRIKSPHPDWAIKYRTSGTELRLIRGNYYLYSYTTVYDKEKKRAKKISGAFLGSITEKEGFVRSSKRELENTLTQKMFSSVQCKEYGVANLVSIGFKEYGRALQKAFGNEWKEILAIAYCRFTYRCPLKNIPFRLASSFLPELLEVEPFGDKQASGILNRIGSMPQQRLSYMKSFIKKGDYILMDATDVTSQSKLISLARKGYNSHMNFDSQFNLMYIYSATSRMPVYYRLLPGNIREVKAFKNSLLEAGLKTAIVVADKGFYSADNLALLQNEKLNFVLPVRRDNLLINFTPLVKNTFKDGANYFDHVKRPIWHKKQIIEKKLFLCLFLDEQLRVKEEADYLTRIKTHPEKYNLKEYHLRKNKFGTIALLTNLKHKEQEIYETYKSRMAIEVMFDGMKNILEADHTYMQNEQTLQGWMFINHITLQWYQHLYIELKEKGLLKEISVNDYIQHLTDVKKIKINDRWYFNEFTNKTKLLMGKLKINMEV